MDDDLGPAIFPFIELIVRVLRICQSNFVRDDETRLGLASNDHVAEVSVVCLDIALTSTDGKALRQVRSETVVLEGKEHLPSRRAFRSSS